MQPSQLNPCFFTIYRGDDVNQPLQLTNNGNPVNLSTATDIQITLKNDSTITPTPPPATQVFKLSSGGGIVAINLLVAQFNLVISAALSTVLNPENMADFDAVVTDASGKQQTYRFSQALSIQDRVVPAPGS